MKIDGRLLMIGGALLLAGCAHHRPAPAAVSAGTIPAGPASPTAGWRAIATPADRARLRNWRTSWIRAIAKITQAGLDERLRAEGALLQPDAALTDPLPPPGDFRCRVIKLGSIVPGGNDLVAYPPYRCRIAREGDRIRFAKIDGAQRPVGWLFAGEENRMIFLGTMLLGDETRAMEYGRDADRDMAGTLERIGPARWRLVLPEPRWESTIDVMELVPLS